jgi:hypothetical protein
MTGTAPVLSQQQQYHRIPPDAMAAAPMAVDRTALVREKNRQHAKESRLKKKAVLNDLTVRHFPTVLHSCSSGVGALLCSLVTCKHITDL